MAAQAENGRLQAALEQAHADARREAADRANKAQLAKATKDREAYLKVAHAPKKQAKKGAGAREPARFARDPARGLMFWKPPMGSGPPKY